MTNPATGTTRVQRLLSLDVLRGVTIAFMIMVNNNGGSGSWGFMNHAAWNGLTPTDLVFPTFVFVVGASIAFAFDARLARGATRAELAWHTLRRAGILFVLRGVAPNGKAAMIEKFATGLDHPFGIAYQEQLLAGFFLVKKGQGCFFVGFDELIGVSEDFGLEPSFHVGLVGRSVHCSEEVPIADTSG